VKPPVRVVWLAIGCRFRLLLPDVPNALPTAPPRPPLSDPPFSTDIRGELVFLGTGTSHGVPVIGCDCATCRSCVPKNQRSRCSALLGLPEGNLLIDTAPDLRVQLLRERIAAVHAVCYTHDHADHLFGLDDLRVLVYYLGHEMPIHCDRHVEDRIRRVFEYAFDPATQALPRGALPQLTFRAITGEPFELLGTRVVPIPLRHGPFHAWGYRVGNVAYCTDANAIPPQSVPLLEGLDVLILDALRLRPHATHFSLDEAIAAARQLAPKRTLFTHICHELEHEAIGATLPSGMELAYDGMKIPLEL